MRRVIDRGAPPARPAAAILLVTRDGRVLVGERAGVPFLTGFVAFPRAVVEMPLTGSFDLARFREGALRELATGLGVILGAGGRLMAIPRELRPLPPAEIYRTVGMAMPPPEELIFAGRWVTPDFSPSRFDTRYFLAIADNEVELAPSEELAWAKFMRPEQILSDWAGFKVLLSPQTRHTLEVLARGFEEACRRLPGLPEELGEPSVEFEPIPGISLMPLRTPTLPPARHTNSYIIGGERLIVIDPATPEESEREKLLERIEKRTRAGSVVHAILLTHHHRDHVGATNWLKGHLRVPVIAHPANNELLREHDITVEGKIEQGEVIDLGAGFLLDVLHTPGHSPGHVVLVDRRPGARAMIAADMVAGVGTIIIAPNEGGDMAEYIRQLRRLRDMPDSVLFPGHGQPVPNSHAKLDELIRHRLFREEKVVRALKLAAGPARPEDLLAVAYNDAPRNLHVFAAWSCLAHLEKLVADGRAEKIEDRFRSLE